jgi:hypothetical protein
MIKLRGVQKRLGQRRAVKDLSLMVNIERNLRTP